MKRYSTWALVAAAAVATAAPLGAGETIKLKDGSIVYGKVLATTGKWVRIRTANGIRTIDLEDVKWMKGRRAKRKTGVTREGTAQAEPAAGMEGGE